MNSPSLNMRSLLLLTAALSLLPASHALAQMSQPGTPGPSPSSPAPGGGGGTPPGSPNTTLPASPVTTPPTASGGGPPAGPAPAVGASSPAAPPSIGAPAPMTGAPAPVSPAVPILASPFAAVAPTPTPPAGQNTLPAAAPDSVAPTTPGAVPLSLTADEAAALAARKNLGLFAALKDVLASRSGVESAQALSPPSFTIGPAFQTGGTTDGLLFLQPLELNGARRARAGVAHAQLRLSEAQALVQLQSLVYTARSDYYALARAQASLALQQDLLAATQQFDQIARAQVLLGARPGIEAVQTAIEVARARQLVAQAQGEEQAARAALNAYLGRAPLDPVDTSQGLPSSGAAAPAADIAAAQRQALAGRAEVAVAQADRDVPAAQASLYRAQGRPDLSPSFRISQITPTYMDAGLGVVITVPIDYGTRRGLIQQQEQTAQAQADRLTGTQAQVRLDAEQAVARLNAAQAVLGEYDAGLTANARTVLQSALAGFQAGGTTLISVLDAQRTYRQIVSERLNAQASVAEARAALDRAEGAVPPALMAQLARDTRTPQADTRMGNK